MQMLLFRLGLVLFLIGLLTGLAVPFLRNSRMGLSSHLEGVLNGMFLVLLGLLWPHTHLSHAWGVTAVALLVYSTFANWLATLLAAAWGAGSRIAPIAARRPRSLSGEGTCRQFPAGVPFADDRGGRRHRHRRALTFSQRRQRLVPASTG